MPSHKILNQSDARPYQLHELLKSNGRWRLLIFPGDILARPTHDRLFALGKELNATSSFVRRYTPPTQPLDSLIEVLAIHASARKETTIFDFPPMFRPFSPTEGYDYAKIYVDDESYHEGHGEAYKNYGVDREVGCAVILRPDQYVSWIGEWDDVGMMERFFSGFMLAAKGGPNGRGIDEAEEALRYQSEGVANAGVKHRAGDAAVEGLNEGAM